MFWFVGGLKFPLTILNSLKIMQVVCIFAESEKLYKGFLFIFFTPILTLFLWFFFLFG